MIKNISFVFQKIWLKHRGLLCYLILCVLSSLGISVVAVWFPAFVNDELQIGLCIRFEKSAIPYLTQWKSLASGDFAMALEPTNCGFDGRAGATEILKPFEKHINRIRFQILDGKDEIELLEHECREVLECTM